MSPMSKSGLIYVKIRKASGYPGNIPNILSSKLVDTCYQFENIDPGAGHDYLALYPLSDVSSMEAEEVKNALNTSSGGGSFADIEIRIYERRQKFQPFDIPEGEDFVRPITITHLLVRKMLANTTVLTHTRPCPLHSKCLHRARRRR